jgi:phosphoribosylamine--glycine ligase
LRTGSARGVSGMRFLGVGDYCDLAALYLGLVDAGHQVRVSIAEPLCHGTLSGLVPLTEDWEADLLWVREAGADGIVIFENVSHGRGPKQDELRRQGFQVIGGSSWGDRLENDRKFAQDILSSLGMPVAPMHAFTTVAEAKGFVEAHPSRYVLKFGGDEFGAADNYVGQMRDGRDVLAVLAAKFRQHETEKMDFVLMAHVEGIEMGVGAYFDGEHFLLPACLDWEHKKFFPGDLGELTGEMGTVVTYERTGTFFRRTLARIEPLLKEHGYCGYINLNTIVNSQGIWPLEFTCRFGYPGYAILSPLQRTPWAMLFRSMVTHKGSHLDTAPGFAVGIVLTTRPFPYTRTSVREPVGLPILFEGDLSERDRANLHFGEVALDKGQLVTAGFHGWTMVVTGTGPTIAEAQADAYKLVRRVVIPDVRYRNDIGAKLIAGDFKALEELGLLQN